MAIQTRTVLKAYFNTGDFPTETQFANFIDSYRHITDDAIAISEITGLTAALAAATVADGDKGDVVVSGTGTVWTLEASGVTPGTYNSVTVDAKGRVTAGANTGGTTTATISAAGETSMRVRYEGAVAPVLTKASDGNYLLVSGAASRVLSIRWDGNPGGGVDPATYTGGAVNLLIRDADGEQLYGTYEAISKTTGQDARNIPGVLLSQTVPTAGDTNVNLPNAASISGGFILIGKLF
jgi:hypothetical protein